MANQNTALPSLVTCLAVRLTDNTSENLNMGKLHVKATAEAPATAVKRTLVGGYEVFSRFTSGNGLPLLITIPQGCKSCGERAPILWPEVCLRFSQTIGVAFQFFSPNVELWGERSESNTNAKLGVDK